MWLRVRRYIEAEAPADLPCGGQNRINDTSEHKRQVKWSNMAGMKPAAIVMACALHRNDMSALDSEILPEV